MGQHGKVRQIVKNGVHVDEIPVAEDQARDGNTLRAMAREMVERGIVGLHKASKREWLGSDDVDMLAKYVRLLNDLESKTGSEPGKEPSTDPAKMSDSELAKGLK